MAVYTCSNTDSFVPLCKMGLKTSVFTSRSSGLVMVLHENVLDAHPFHFNSRGFKLNRDSVFTWL